jgi:death on curing protein
LKLADALSAHERALRFGGLEGVLNLSLVESALARPYSGYHRQIWQKAAALVQSMGGSNHGFVDGNKRTTLILLHTMVSNSGFYLAPIGGEDIEQAVEDIILAAATRHLALEELFEWFKARIQKISPPPLN